MLRSSRGRGSGTSTISCTRPCVHHHDAVGDQHRLVEIVGDEQDGLLGAGVDFQQFGLHRSRASARRARRTARPSAALSDRWRARGRCRRAAACRRRADSGRRFCESLRPTRSRYFLAVSRSGSPRMPFISRPNITFCSAESHGSSSACWNTMPRSWPQPLTSRPSTRDAAAVRGIEPHGDAQRRGLAAARRPDQRDDLAVAHGEADAVERLHVLHFAVDAQRKALGHVDRDLLHPCGLSVIALQRASINHLRDQLELAAFSRVSASARRLSGSRGVEHFALELADLDHLLLRSS